ncbi:calcium uptake protein 3, mitochondrial-like isoform X4 [Biomphalaria glabrata]|uniref:Calcium uptake protein 3, mitochondrial-like isoform X4 n=1 Tax=Biomphalaria glabrata TaxID=6526 RepID=A0A9W3B541_BIOGL|nr:calcium uptake protein 3, mitochondrial-like isoform X4 [Biomphalaria glabrata]
MANPIQRSVNFVKTIFRKQTVILFSESYLQKFKPSKNVVKLFLFGSASCVSCLVALRLSKSLTIPTVYAAKSSSSSNNEEEASSKIEVSSYREMRFRQFASIEYDGNIYMTPQDFLESLTEESPRARIGRTILTKSDVDSLLKNTPALSKGSGKLFRKLHDKGIISYTEYLFLLCVLTKPHSGFRIAFNMFDTDGNQIVDKKEFLVLENFFILPPNERKFVPRDRKKMLSLEKVFSNGGSKQQKAAEEENQADGQSKKKAAGIQQWILMMQSHEVDIPDTTLLVHFFGKNGKNVLQYKDFHRFMENLQSEVIELEFLEFSKGFSTISEVAFAKILLRYTNLERGEVEDCLKRVKERMPNEKGISFDEFKKFCQFLNNLDDFAIAMKMYTFAQQPVSQEEFMRAVKVCTGFSLDPHIVATLFNIFDTDGDGNLSHKEFISLMKDRLHRGARTHLMHSQNKFEAFKTCVKNEMRTF